MRVSLKVIEGPHLGAEFAFDQYASFVVGRHRKTQFRLSLKDPYLSRFHFYLEIKPPQCVLVDLRSSNHTFVNGRKVERMSLSDGDLIRAGRTTLRVAIEPGRMPPAPPVSSGPPPVIPGYQLKQLLGSGSTGTVYLATDERDQALVALKMIAPGISNCPRSVALFQREAAILRQLEHPHIVSLFGEGTIDQRLYQVMEYVPGCDALRLMANNRGPLPICRAVDLTCQALDGLAHAHKADIVHRDIKPNNLLVTRIGNRDFVKLGDFGLARIFRESSTSGLTREGDVRGTLGYIPPEQIENLRDVKPSADIYGVGATLYSLLTGQTPYNFRGDDRDCFIMILNDDPRDIRNLRPEIPDRLAALIHRALARKPEDRFPDALSMREALAPWTDHPRDGGSGNECPPGSIPTRSPCGAGVANDHLTRPAEEDNSSSSIFPLGEWDVGEV